jgi:adenine/guanine phosphoribosyltransferase-like PRPP-binding protein
MRKRNHTAMKTRPQARYVGPAPEGPFFGACGPIVARMAPAAIPAQRRVPHIPASAFITTERLVADTYRLLADLPAEISAVVGIARSGLLPAGIIAVERHRPLFAATREGHVHPVGYGGRMIGHRASSNNRLVLLVDDTGSTGLTLDLVRPWVQAAFPGATVMTAAIYCAPQSLSRIDWPAVVYPQPHYLEWNFVNSGVIHEAALDFDGILCEDCPPEADDDGDAYRQFLETARPKYIPRREPLAAIVTARLEKYRAPTLRWLDRWGVQCRQLVMGPWKTIAARRQAGPLGKWKAREFTKLGLDLFVESDPVQAAEICRFAAKPVLCPAAQRLFQPQPDCKP